MSHWLALSLAPYFLASPPRNFCHWLNGSRPGLVVDDLPVVDARHDEKAAIGLEIFPVTKLNHLAVLAHPCQAIQGPRRYDSVSREEDDSMRIYKSCFDETTAA